MRLSWSVTGDGDVDGVTLAIVVNALFNADDTRLAAAARLVVRNDDDISIGVSLLTGFTPWASSTFSRTCTTAAVTSAAAAAAPDPDVAHVSLLKQLPPPSTLVVVSEELRPSVSGALFKVAGSTGVVAVMDAKHSCRDGAFELFAVLNMFPREVHEEECEDGPTVTGSDGGVVARARVAGTGTAAVTPAAGIVEGAGGVGVAASAAVT